jgi:hypothetical protein
MKSFPDQFPIRYAITVLDHTKSSHNNDYFNEARSKVLWDQLIDLLQTKPLGLEDLSQGYSAIAYAYKDVQLCSIPKLGSETQWSNDATKYLSEIIDSGHFYHGGGSAYSIGLMSYQRMAETPMFYQVANHGDDPKYRFEKLGLGSWGHIFLDEDKKEAKRIMDMYSRVTDKHEYWRYEKMRSTQELEVIEMRVPYSPLWAVLDQKKDYGIIPPMADKIKIDASDLDAIDMSNEPSHISVTLVRNLSALFWAEMAALYRVANFCNNCSSVLDFGSKQKYCDEKTNPECAKDRARKRQQKSHKNRS